MHKRAMHWISWNAVCSPKNRGGLGILDAPKHALTMYAKFLVALSQQNQSWAVMLKVLGCSFLAELVLGSYA